ATLYVLGPLYLGAFFFFYARFSWLEREVRRGRPGAPERLERALHGFPNALYAKQFGKAK
ncbi:MAG: hypothetical protein ACYDBQ_01855, partial [Thermoplasmatota archaeon]